MTDSLISRQAAVDTFNGSKVDEEYCTEYDIGYNDGIDFAVSKLSVLPSAEPEVISCLDCIHYTPLGIDKSWGRCAIHSSPTENQRMCQSCDFCAWAERRTDETD